MAVCGQQEIPYNPPNSQFKAFLNPVSNLIFHYAQLSLWPYLIANSALAKLLDPKPKLLFFSYTFYLLK
jgi:hypothetical protein